MIGRARRAAAAPLLAVALLACNPAKVSTPAPAGARVHVEAAGGTATVAVEIARTPREQEKGLMDRPRLDADAGMIFVFGETAPHGFWMRNTLVALDLVFIGEDLRVAAVVERAPLGLDTDDGGVASRYVLEVNRGWSRAHGVRVGDRVRLENVLY